MTYDLNTKEGWVAVSELCEAATPVPPLDGSIPEPGWKTHRADNEDGSITYFVLDGGDVLWTSDSDAQYGKAKADAEFIAAAHRALPQALTIIDQMEGEIAVLRARNVRVAVLTARIDQRDSRIAKLESELEHMAAAYDIGAGVGD